MSKVFPHVSGKDFSELERKLRIEFSDKDLLVQAFCHRSYINENGGFPLSHNERLEFLGDAVVELAVTEYLYKAYPEKPEGDLTNWRAALVNAKQLAKAAHDLGFNDYLLLSKGESREEGKARMYILSNTFEAFLGSMYLEFGYEACRKFLEEHLLTYLEEIITKGLDKDAKTKLQEIAQEKEKVTPSYQVMNESGPDHRKHFTVGVFLHNKLVASGEGPSKQEAQEAAAESALKVKQWQ